MIDRGDRLVTLAQGLCLGGRPLHAALVVARLLGLLTLIPGGAFGLLEPPHTAAVQLVEVVRISGIVGATPTPPSSGSADVVEAPRLRVAL